VSSTPTPDVPTLLSRIEGREAVVGIVGLGYVGLPLVIGFANAGFRVIGFDIDADKIAKLAARESYIAHISSDALSALSADLFKPTADASDLGDADAILICVPTPLTEHLEPDLSFVTSTAEMIARHLKRGQIVSLESTTYPGTTAEVLTPILESGSGLTAGEDFFVAYSPEREDPGNLNFNTETIPKVVGGATPDALRIAEALYGALVSKVVPVSSLETAEAVKLTENIFRAVNIAMVNELKLVYGAMGIDVWEVIEAAKTKPFGYMPFYPGPGLGGHCIPIDPFYLTWRARAFGKRTKFIELSGEINRAMPEHVISTLSTALSTNAGVALSRAKVLVLGLAYKKNVGDVRESPALTILRLLKAAGAEARFHDPHADVIPQTREFGDFAGDQSLALGAEAIAGFDAVLIVTDHDAIDWDLVGANSRLIVDTRNVMAGRDVAGTLVKA